MDQKVKKYLAYITCYYLVRFFNLAILLSFLLLIVSRFLNVCKTFSRFKTTIFFIVVIDQISSHSDKLSPGSLFSFHVIGNWYENHV